MKIGKTLIIGILVIALIPTYFIFKYTSVVNSEIGEGSEKKVFTIDAGMTGYQVVEKLSAEGVIKSGDVRYMKAYLRLNKIPHFQEGSFNIPMNLTVKELFDTLQNPESTDVWVTIQEGLRADEIADIFEKELSSYEDSNFSKSKFMQLVEDKEYIATLGLAPEAQTLEGYLFPDKYLLPRESTEQYLIETLVDHFKSKVGAIAYDDLIIASMVEREGKTNEERPYIADIIKRRLAEGWYLGIDATLLYPKKDWKHILTHQDLTTDGPYNTRTRAGLPPTPISNPGLSSINATKNPTSNDYYYYLHGNDGKIRYGRTQAEHEMNIINYLQ